MIRRLSFYQRLWIPLGFSLLCLLAVATFGVVQNRMSGLAERERGLREAGEIARSIVLRYAKLVETGKMSPTDAKLEALTVLRTVRFGEDGYIVVIDSGMHSIMNPSKPETEGRFLGDYQDEKGKFVYREMVSIAKSGGDGLLDYYTHRPGGVEQIRKRSFVKPYLPWDWIFVTGAYLDDIDAAFARSIYLVFSFVLAVSVLLSCIVFLTNRFLVRTLGGSPEYAKAVVRATAGGDLSVQIDTRPDDKDSLVAQIIEMQVRLRGAVAEIQRGAETITLAMEEVATGNADLSQRTEEQAAALEQTASSMAEFRKAVTDNSESAKAASKRAEEAFSTARRGNDAVSAVTNTMGHITKSSTQVNDILGMIKSVSFQTNILALNAAVEAARAKEHGRGFAVVASEVRALAQRSSAASRDIESLIGRSDAHVQEGARLADDAGECMSQIFYIVQQVDVLLKEIALASEEQSVGIEQISRALSQMDEVTQQNAALVEQSAAAAQSVRDQARKLLASTSIFKLS
ncbi:methyl-accepting chemotaxis sensory transducer with Cache sensor [Paraburkholderia hospita]|nr:methyl-accepting chemotaxis sensory transducer with Cache sensor [Paraburkholderia hospita]